MATNYERLVTDDNDEAGLISVVIPTGIVASRGVAITLDTVTETSGVITGKLAQPTDQKLLGHTSKDVNADGGPSIADQLFGNVNVTTGRLESAAKAGDELALEKNQLYAIEDPLCATVVTDEITTAEVLSKATTKGKLINFKNGLAKIALTGEYAHYSVAGTSDALGTSNTFRIFLTKIDSVLVTA